MTQEESRGGGSAAGKIRRGDLGKESRAGEGMEGEERATEGEERAKGLLLLPRAVNSSSNKGSKRPRQQQHRQQRKQLSNEKIGTGLKKKQFLFLEMNISRRCTVDSV